MMDAGHSHGPNPYLVDGCPLCDAEKTARNQAIEHLAEALYLLSPIHPEEDRPTLRLNLAPIGLTGDDVHRCHSINLTAKQAEALSDAIDSMNAYLGSEAPAPAELASPVPADRLSEEIPSGEWSAAAVAQNETDLWDQVNDAFDELDLVEVTKQVLDDPCASKLTVTLALDSLLGEIGDTYADEDDA